MLTRPEGRLRPVRILPPDGVLVTLDFGEGIPDFGKL